MPRLLIALLVLALVSAARAQEALIELPSPTREELSELTRDLGLPPERTPASASNSLRALFLRPDLPRAIVTAELSIRRSLTPRSYWMLGLAVSATNRCDYCLSSAAASLRLQGAEEPLIQALSLDPASAPLDAREQAMVQYAVWLTQDPEGSSPGRVERLREVGFGDQEIMEITLVTSWYNFLNRMALGLQYGPDASHPFTP